MRVTSLLLFASALLDRAEETAVGRWEGSVQVPSRELKLIVDIAQDNGGNWTGSITLPGLNIKGAALADLVVHGAHVAFSIKTALAELRTGQAKFDAQVATNGKLNGRFAQGGNAAAFTLEKTGPPQVEVARRSTPITKAVEGEWKGEYELFGYPRKVTIKLRNRGVDEAGAEFVIVGRKVNNLPVDFVRQDGAFLTIDSPVTG